MVGTAHFHCPTCTGPLVFGQTRAVCGAVIPPQKKARLGLNRRCWGCKAQLAKHAHDTASVPLAPL